MPSRFTLSRSLRGAGGDHPQQQAEYAQVQETQSSTSHLCAPEAANAKKNHAEGGEEDAGRERELTHCLSAPFLLSFAVLVR
jgi:hypothetical protein